MLNVIRILILLSTAIGLAACSNSHFEDPEARYIGKYKSPFADNKVLLGTPSSKVINRKTNSKVAFDPELDSIPASVLINMTCARQSCDQEEREDVGRISCAGYKKAVEQKWPEAINRFSFSYIFKPGETPEQILTALETDSVDKNCVVGISNYVEMKFNRTNDPDVDIVANAAYAASPYLDQINYFTAQNSLSGLSAQVRIGIIDGDFFLGNTDISAGYYVTDVGNYGKRYPVDGNKIINVGGAPPVGNSLGHGNLVSELIFGNGNNAIAGVGVASPVGSFSPRLVAANVRSVDPETGTPYISVDNINNALALMAHMKVDVINISLGVKTEAANPPQTLETAILSAIGQGSVVVVAAGNDTFNMTLRKNANGSDSKYQAYPAAWGVDYFGLLTVAALDSAGSNLAYFSNFGVDKVDIAAPGENMVIAGNTYRSGTSFAAPLVTGSVAIMAAYYKNKGIPVVPEQIEIALLAGSKNIPALNPRVKNGLSLDVPSIITQLTTKSVSQVPKAVLDTVDGFWYTRNGTSMTYSIRTVASNVDESDSSLRVGIWEMFDMKLPPLASVEAHNGTDNFELPFYNFVVGSEGVWVVLYRSTTENGKEKRIAISSKLYKFVDLIKSPTVDESNVLGAINEVATSVNGWACLSGRPDHLAIDVRVGSPSGPLLFKTDETIFTSVQPKGREYFDQCTPFTIMLGFKVPLQKLAPNTDYYFVARHPTLPEKSKLLNVKPFRIEVEEARDPIFYNLKKSIVNGKVSVKGSVCWENQKEPGIISHYPEGNLFLTSRTFKDWFIKSILPMQTDLNNLYKAKKIGLYTSSRILDYRTIELSPTPLNLGAYTAYDTTGNSLNSGSSHITKGDVITGLDALSYLKKNSFVPSRADLGFGCCGSLGIMTVGSARESTIVDGVTTTTAKTWFVDPDQTFPASVTAAMRNPLIVDDSTITITDAPAACMNVPVGAAPKKTGVGQDFIITMTRATLANHFNIADNVAVVDGDTPEGYTLEQIKTLTDQLNVAYRANLYPGFKGIMNTVLTTGDFDLIIVGYSHSSTTATQQFKVSDLTNY